MPIDVNWYDDTQTALLVTYGKTFKLEEFYESIDTSYKMMESVPWKIDIVQDVSQLTGLPPNMLSIVRYVEGKSHPRRGISIVVGVNRFVKVMFDIGKAWAPKATENYHFVDTREDAHSLLLKLRPTRSQATDK